MAYLSVPSPGKLILDIFGTNIVRQFVGLVFGPGDKTQISRFKTQIFSWQSFRAINSERKSNESY